MKRSAVITVGLLGMVAIGSTFFLHPSDTEIALMEMEDRHFTRAQKQYEELLEKGDYSVNVVMPLCRLYVEKGEIEKATEIMRRYAAKFPDSLLALRQLAEYQRDAQHYYDYVRTLEAIRRLKPDTALLRELAEYYQFLGEHKARLSALSQLVQMDDYAPNEKELISTAKMMNEAGERAKAREIMQRYLGNNLKQASPSAVETTIYLLLADNKEEEALKLGKEFLEKHAQPEDVRHVSRFLRQQNHANLAWDLLQQHLSVLSREPLLLEEIFLIELAQGRKKEALELLMPYVKSKSVPAALKESLLDLAMEYEDETLLANAIEAFPDAEISESLFVNAAQIALRQQKPGLVKPMLPFARKRFGEGSLTVLLLEAASDPSEAHLKTLTNADLKTLTIEQRISIADLLFRVNLPERAITVLEPVPMEDVLQEIDPRDMAELYLKAGKGEDAEKAIRKAGGHLTEKNELALALLAIGRGDVKPFHAWSEHYPPKVTPDTLEMAYYLAVTYGRTHPASLLAELYRREPTPARRIDLVNALLAEGSLSTAIEHIKAMPAENPDVRQLMFAALEKSMQSPTRLRKADTEWLLGKLRAHATNSVDEQRELGYALIAGGMPQEAEPIFAQLAQSSVSPDANDIEQWADLWSSPPTKAQETWALEKASAGDEATRKKWADLLLAKNGGPALLKLINTMPMQALTPTMRDLYLDALSAQKDQRRAGEFLKAELTRADSADALRRVAHAADTQELPTLSNEAFKKLQQRKSNDPEANLRLGLLALEEGREVDARNHLEMSLTRTTEDIEPLRALGESWQKENPSKALNYYSQSLALINHLPKRNFEMRRLQAQLFYLTNQADKAIALYRELLKEQPKHNEIRADFAAMLVEKRQFEEAEQVLSPKGDGNHEPKK